MTTCNVESSRSGEEDWWGQWMRVWAGCEAPLNISTPGYQPRYTFTCLLTSHCQGETQR